MRLLEPITFIHMAEKTATAVECYTCGGYAFHGLKF